MTRSAPAKAPEGSLPAPVPKRGVRAAESKRTRRNGKPTRGRSLSAQAEPTSVNSMSRQELAQ